MKPFSAVLVAALVLTSTAPAWAAKAITDADLAQLKIGQTTYHDVVARFGPPVSTERSSDGVQVIVYAVVRTHIKAASYLPIVGLFAGGATAASSTETFVFDGNGVLQRVFTSDTAIDCGTLGGCAGVAPAASARETYASREAPAPAPVHDPVPSVTSAYDAAAVAPPPAPAKPARPARANCIRVLTDPGQSAC